MKALTPEGYDAAWDKIVPAAVELAKQGATAILVHGASLTFYRGHAAHEKLLANVRAATGLPAISMTSAMVDGLRRTDTRLRAAPGKFITVTHVEEGTMNALLASLLTCNASLSHIRPWRSRRPAQMRSCHWYSGKADVPAPRRSQGPLTDS